ncbi:MAG: ISNCY family transposase [Candidatus Electrothrix aestuarii]|uniref:ISNCY family transposase n=1 Tax=Candidatus Electrothrix aestuarii TaxID=3062594 RepID=A0AAU8M189_9BACT
MFFNQSPSFLSYQRAMQQAHGHNNAQSLFGITQIMSDNQTRNLLDTLTSDNFYPIFSETFDRLESAGYLDRYRVLDDYLLVPIDGTEFFRSSKIHCENCSVTRNSNGTVSYSHKVLTPVVAAPDNNKVIALEPEFVTPQDGSAKQDCELNAAKRWIERNSSLSDRKVIILGDDLFSRGPFCNLLSAHSFRFILICKPSSHTTLYQYVAELEKKDGITVSSQRKWNGKFHELHTYRYANDLTLKQGDDAPSVNWVELTVINTKTQEVLYKNTFITDFKIDRTNVQSIVQAGRTRWKVENENNNILKTKGYHLDHNFGHGDKFLSNTLLTLNLVAFLAHTFLEFVDKKYKAVRSVLSVRKTFFNDLKALTKYLFFSNWSQLINFMFEQLEIKRLST